MGESEDHELMGKKPNDNWFKDIFGITMAKVGEEIGVTKAYISHGLSKRSMSERVAKQVIQILEERRDENYREEIEIAEYKRRKANEVIERIIEIGIEGR